MNEAGGNRSHSQETRVMDVGVQLDFSFSFSLGPQPLGLCCPYLDVFSPQLSRDSLTDL